MNRPVVSMLRENRAYNVVNPSSCEKKVNVYQRYIEPPEILGMSDRVTLRARKNSGEVERDTDNFNHSALN